MHTYNPDSSKSIRRPPCFLHFNPLPRNSPCSIGVHGPARSTEKSTAQARHGPIYRVGFGPRSRLKGKCAFGPFLSILVIKCQHKCLNVNLCPWMNKVQITSKGMFLSLSTLVLCTNIFV